MHRPLSTDNLNPVTRLPMDSDCRDLCTKATALKTCINTECNSGTQPASGSWQSDCAEFQTNLDIWYKPQDVHGISVTLCKGGCDMKCSEIGSCTGGTILHWVIIFALAGAFVSLILGPPLSACLRTD